MQYCHGCRLEPGNSKGQYCMIIHGSFQGHSCYCEAVAVPATVPKFFFFMEKNLKCSDKSIPEYKKIQLFSSNHGLQLCQ